MHNLTDCGFLEKDTGGKFAPGESFFALPLVGSVPAGFPVPDAAEVSDTLSLDQYLVDKPSSSFLLKVSGDSLKDLGILPGDLAVIEKTARAKHNDVVLARVDGEWTLKIFTLRNKSVVLLPANVAYRPIVPRHELSVYGVMKGIVRKMN